MTINLKADTTGKYGEYGVLSALYDVEAAFNSASGSRKKRHDFSFDPNSTLINGDRPDTFHVEDHIQSVARLSGEGQENILVFTRSARDAGDAGLYVVPFNGIESDENTWKWASSLYSTRILEGFPLMPMARVHQKPSKLQLSNNTVLSHSDIFIV